MNRRTLRIIRPVGVVAVSALVGLSACSSGVDDSPTPTDQTVDNDSNPDNQGTVVPPDDNGVGGGAPNDDLDENIEPGADDTDGDGRPDEAPDG